MMTASLKDWTETRLHTRIIQGAESKLPCFDEARRTLENRLARIQAVLQQGGTGATDFTLHDAQHGFRVAERMVEIIPADVLDALSAYELALLLFSAYLHDIGMTPERHRVKGHYRYLLTGETGHMDEAEIDAFRQWLDVHGDGLSPPLIQGTPTGKTLGEAEWLVAHYCRERHNDWSGEWIETNLIDERLGDYDNWQTDLITICKSHHVGFDELAKPRFDPIEVGAAGSVVHLRYLAAALRLADVMENDPERTPDVVLRQRNVSPSSLVFWQKDHGVSLARTENQYRLIARPRSALIHKAVSETAKQIEQELLVCRRLADETNFSFLRGSSKPLPHRWDLTATLTTKIDPLESAYEYIEGTFRPDIHRVLRLLAGIELYGDEMAAVRELVQNAFDAVRERIARERLLDPGNPHRSELLGRLHSVELGLEERDGAFWLVCRDQGAGMTKAIIRDHLLVSGAVRRDDLLRLSRQCEAADFCLERTARFGIGVLSYFMIADQIHIRTRRCQASLAGETTGWSFVTDGLNGFGELKRDSRSGDGTEVRLRIKPSVLGDDPPVFWQKLVAYLQRVLTKTPCRLIVAAEPLSQIRWFVDSPGWIRDGADYAEQSLSVLAPQLRSPTRHASLFEDLDDLIPSDRRSSWEHARDQQQERHDEAHRRLRWSASVTGELPNGLGTYRVFFPWFDLDAGPCLHFLEFEENDGAMILTGHSDSGSSVGQAPWCPITMSWFGVQADHELESLKKYRCPGVVEINWTSEAAGRIEVSRNQIQLSEEAERAIEEVIAQLKQQIRVFSQNYLDSRFALYNTTVAEAEPPPVENWYWLCQHETKLRFEWRPLRFPAVAPIYRDDSALLAAGAYRAAVRTVKRYFPEVAQVEQKERSPIPIDGYRSSEQLVSRYCGVNASTQPPNQPQGDDEFLSRGYSTYTTWYSPNLAPTRVMEIVDPYRRLWTTAVNRRTGLLWEQAPKWRKPRVAHPEAEFPPEWQGLCLIVHPPQRIWNRSHKLVQATSGKAWKELMESPCRGGDPRPWATKLKSDAELAAAWLLFCLSMGSASLVQGVAEHSPELLQAMWEAVFPAQEMSECWAIIDDSRGRNLVRIGPFGWEDYDATVANEAEYATHFPEPSSEWRMFGVDPNNGDT